MKPPDRPTPGRTDRILGVMGGMLRACAVPGQEGVRRRDRRWGRGSLGDFRRSALRDSVYLQTKVIWSSQSVAGIPKFGYKGHRPSKFLLNPSELCAV